MASTRTLLSIAPNLKLPEEAVTETFAILGKRGAGKTTTTRVLTEELLHVGLPALIPGSHRRVVGTTSICRRRRRRLPRDHLRRRPRGCPARGNQRHREGVLPLSGLTRRGAGARGGLQPGPATDPGGSTPDVPGPRGDGASDEPARSRRAVSPAPEDATGGRPAASGGEPRVGAGPVGRDLAVRRRLPDRRVVWPSSGRPSSNSHMSQGWASGQIGLFSWA
jgi:hypothetical protein